MDVEAWVTGGDLVVNGTPGPGYPYDPSVTGHHHPPSSRMRLYDPNTRPPHALMVSRTAASIPSTKPKGLPVLGEQIVQLHQAKAELEEGESRNTPYRLPRIPTLGRRETDGNDHDVTFSRHGYQVQSASPDDLMTTRSLGGGNSARVLASAQVAEIRRQQYNAQYPHFRQATITPVSSRQRYYAGSIADPAFFRSAYTERRSNTVHGGDAAPGTRFPRPTPVPPTHPTSPMPHPPKSAHSTKSIQWALTPYKKHGYDKKGIKSAQGPYSREFTRTCMAPNNWLKMKLGRHKSAPT